MVDYSPYGTGQPQESMLGFTGEPVDDNGLVHLRARYYDPSLGVFPSLDPVEGNMQRVMSFNGYFWVEGNVINLIDPSGLTPGCGNKSCLDFLNEMYNIIWGYTNRIGNFVKGLRDRFTEMFDDICHQYDRDILGQPLIGPLLASCYLAGTINTSYGGHQQAFTDRQNSLDRAIGCYGSKGLQLYQARGDNSQLCDYNDATYKAALSWSSRNLTSGNIVPQRHGGSPHPQLPPVPIVVDEFEQILTFPALEPAPEPPPPHGRGHNVPSSIPGCGPICKMAEFVAYTAGMCLFAFAAVGVAAAAPEVVPAVGTICVRNPELCLAPVQ